MIPVISTDTLRVIARAIQEEEKEIAISLDLGLTTTKITVTNQGIIYNNKIIAIKTPREKEKNCYYINKDRLEKIQFFADNKLYQLIPTSYRPIMKIAGNPMHKQPFIERIEREKLKGKILDAGTGLGYTAIAAAKTAKEVITLERDQNVIELAKLNPYSQELFKNETIKQLKGDIVKKIITWKDHTFDAIILDGGTPRSSGDFFSLKNYEQAYRVLKNKKKLFHYVPSHHEKQGRDFIAETITRLKKAGFKTISPYKQDNYVIAEKD